jgi:hypothetical protein
MLEAGLMLNVATPKSLSDTSFQQDSLSEGSTPSEHGTQFSPARHQPWAMSKVSVAASGRTWSIVPGVLSFDPVWYPNIAWMHHVFASDPPENGPLVIFNAIQQLYCQDNSRDRRIAERLKTLYRDSLDEGEKMQAASVRQFAPMSSGFAGAVARRGHLRARIGLERHLVQRLRAVLKTAERFLGQSNHC